LQATRIDAHAAAQHPLLLLLGHLAIQIFKRLGLRSLGLILAELAGGHVWSSFAAAVTSTTWGRGL